MTHPRPASRSEGSAEPRLRRVAESRGLRTVTVNPEAGEGYVDWDWLVGQPGEGQEHVVRHLRLPAPLVIKMSGKTGEGVILKPSST